MAGTKSTSADAWQGCYGWSNDDLMMVMIMIMVMTTTTMMMSAERVAHASVEQTLVENASVAHASATPASVAIGFQELQLW